MSVEPQLERSILERKDRDELHRIANAMGGKPGSRARKAEIVDLILELAGVGESSSEPSEPEPEAAGDVESAAKPRKRAPRKATPVVDDAADEGDEEDEPSASASSNGRGTEPTADDDQGGDEDGNAADEGSAPERASSPTESDREGRDRASGAGSNGRPNDQGQPPAEGETGNRRRRRRGRNRDRDPQTAATGQDEQWQGEPVEVLGLLDLRDEGYGFLRLNGYLPSKEDVYVSVKQVRQFGLRKGDHIKGASRPAGRSEKNPALLRIDEVNGEDPDLGRSRPHFDELTAVPPSEQLTLERAGQPEALTARLIDLVAPLGKGQRGLVVAPPKAGKSAVLREIAASIEQNHPDVHVLVVLVDERPEDVTAIGRDLGGEVVASTFDRPAEEHTMVAELAIERAKRLVEDGRDVVVLLDGLTRLSRAYNVAAPPAGRSIADGLEGGALYAPKRFFAAARDVEEGGSLTIVATALIGTGSKIDEAIFEEFEGTANQEVRLDRRLADRRTFPAIDIGASSTRQEQALLDANTLEQVAKLRRQLQDGVALEQVIEQLAASKSNAAFLADIAKKA